MDYFAHGLWSYVFFHKIRKPWLAVLFGVLPDTLSWAIYFIYRLITGTFAQGPPNIAAIPQWVWTLYGVTHSLLVFIVVWLIIYVLLKKVPLYIYAWPIHILIDIPTHRELYLPTPFLWPVSSYAFPGISWGNPVFMTANYLLLFSSLTYILIMRHKR